MKLAAFLAGCSLALVTVVSAQTYTTETTSGTITVQGDVIRYEPGRTIVIRGADNKEVTYTLSPSITVPAEVQVGRRVTLYTEAGSDGTALVSRVVTTSVTPEGNVKRTTEETRRGPSGTTTKVTTTTTSGKVEAYIPGKTLTVLRADGSRVTYVVNEQSQLPSDLVIGKTVAIQPLITSKEPIAKIVTYEVVPEP
jgi:hypothetical protein